MKTIPTKLQQLLQCKSHEELLEFIRRCDADGKYANHLPVSWDYWHFGKHAEVALDLGLKELSLLMSAAWEMMSVLTFDVCQQKLRAREIKKIRLTYQPRLESIS